MFLYFILKWLPPFVKVINSFRLWVNFVRFKYIQENWQLVQIWSLGMGVEIVMTATRATAAAAIGAAAAAIGFMICLCLTLAKPTS